MAAIEHWAALGHGQGLSQGQGLGGNTAQGQGLCPADLPVMLGRLVGRSLLTPKSTPYPLSIPHRTPISTHHIPLNIPYSYTKPYSYPPHIIKFSSPPHRFLLSTESLPLNDENNEGDLPEEQPIYYNRPLIYYNVIHPTGFYSPPNLKTTRIMRAIYQMKTNTIMILMLMLIVMTRRMGSNIKRIMVISMMVA